MTTILATGRSHKEDLSSRTEQFTPRIYPGQNPQNAIAKYLSQLFHALEIWGNRYRQRRQLAEMDQERLRDMGIGPSEVSREIAKPFWVT